MRSSWRSLSGRALAACALAVLVPLGPATAADAAGTADPTVTSSSRFSLAASATTLAPGDPLTLTLTTTNRDPSIARVARFHLTTQGAAGPLGAATCASASGPLPQICASNTGGYTLHVEYPHEKRLPAGTTGVTVITTSVRPDAAPGTYRIVPDGLFSDNGQNEPFSPSSFTVTVTPRQADLAVGLGATSSLLSGGIQYTATAVNNGPGALASATLTTQLPPQTVGVGDLPAACAFDQGAKAVTCATGPLAVSASTGFTFRADLGLLAVGLPLNATVTRTAGTPTDPNAANDTATAGCTVVTSLLIAC